MQPTVVSMQQGQHKSKKIRWDLKKKITKSFASEKLRVKKWRSQPLNTLRSFQKNKKKLKKRERKNTNTAQYYYHGSEQFCFCKRLLSTPRYIYTHLKQIKRIRVTAPPISVFSSVFKRPARVSQQTNGCLKLEILIALSHSAWEIVFFSKRLGFSKYNEKILMWSDLSWAVFHLLFKKYIGKVNICFVLYLARTLDYFELMPMILSSLAKQPTFEGTDAVL